MKRFLMKSIENIVVHNIILKKKLETDIASDDDDHELHTRLHDENDKRRQSKCIILETKNISSIYNNIIFKGHLRIHLVCNKIS